MTINVMDVLFLEDDKRFITVSDRKMLIWSPAEIEPGRWTNERLLPDAMVQSFGYCIWIVNGENILSVEKEGGREARGRNVPLTLISINISDRSVTTSSELGEDLASINSAETIGLSSSTRLVCRVDTEGWSDAYTINLETNQGNLIATDSVSCLVEPAWGSPRTFSASTSKIFGSITVMFVTWLFLALAMTMANSWSMVHFRSK